MKAKTTLLTFGILLFLHGILLSQALIIDHNCTDIDAIPESAINNAKDQLHIAYGHTSHGSQLITGMNNLDAFMGGNDLYVWNDGPLEGYLDIDDNFTYGDLGASDWDDRTRVYLDNSANADVNVVIWSWCGQLSWYSESLVDQYLSDMTSLENDYPDVDFVYMTGHLDGTGLSGTLHENNESIRSYCNSNSKILFDFADIETYDPDNTYFGDKIPDDNCDYDSDSNGSQDGNWANEWENTHDEDVDWYSCSCAHSQALNCNQKAYGAWWLWSSLADWSLSVSLISFSGSTTDTGAELHWETAQEEHFKGFYIERKTYYSPVWESIAFISGQKENSCGDKYSHHDILTSPSIYYYRLKQVDYDGNYQYSKAIKVSFQGNKPGFALESYPNPCSSTSTIQYFLKTAEHVKLQVFDMYGNKIKNIADGKQQKGLQKIIYNTENLPSGIYFCKLAVNEEFQIIKMVKE